MPATSARPLESPSASARRPALLGPGLLLNVLISSGTFLVAKSALREFPALPLALFRFVLTSLALVPVARALQPGVRIARADRPRIILLGLIAVMLNQALFLIGMQWTSASHAALLYALTPAFVVLVAARFGGARATALQIGGIALAFAGVLALLVQRGLHFDRSGMVGDLVIFGAVIAWAFYLVLGRDLSRRYGPLVLTAETLLAGTVAFLPIGLVSLIGFHPARISLGAWGGLFYLAWLTSGVNYVLWFWGLSHLRPATVALITNLQPVVTVAMAWAFLREPLPGGFWLSTVLVLGGVWLTQAARFPADRAEPA